MYAHEHIKWGDYVNAKVLVKEAYLHSRILKDQSAYATALSLLSKIAYIEGESASALRLDMQCHRYAKDMAFIEKAVEQTFDLLVEFDKFEDVADLIDPVINMVIEVKQDREGDVLSTSQNAVQNNLPADFALSTFYLLKAVYFLKLSGQTKPHT
jgi:hypothetical protein